MGLEKGFRKVSYRYVAMRNGVEYMPLQAIGSPSITMSSVAEIKRSMSGSFIVPEQVDLLTDMIKIFMVADGEEAPLGEFVVRSATNHYGETKYTQVEAYDASVKVKNTYISERVYIPAGTSYNDAIGAQLIACGIERVIIDNPGKNIVTNREDWDIGTSRIKIINDLLSEINYRSLWFDNNGYARVSKYITPSVDAATKVYKADSVSIISDECSKSLDVFNAYNAFTVAVSNADYGIVLMAYAYNEDPGSATSIQRIGLRQAPVEFLSNIADAQALQKYVNNVRDKSKISTETVTWHTANTPHEVGEIVIIDHPNLRGIFEETEWTMQLAVGAQMMHKGKRVVYI